MAVFELFPGSLLDLKHTVKDAPARRSNVQTLQLVQVVTALRVPNPRTPSVRHSLALGQTVSVGAKHNLAVVTPLWLAHRGVRVRNFAVYQFCGLSQRALPNQPKPVVQFVSFVQQAKGQLGKPGKSVLVFGQTASLTVKKNLTPNSVLPLVGAASAWIAHPRFIGSEIPTLTPAATLTLQYGDTVIVLPSPNFGNSERLSFTRINRKTRGGDLMVFRDQAWPKDDILTYEFDHLSEPIAQSLLRFFAQTLGRDVTLTDHESRKWIGYVLTPGQDVLQPAPKYGCSKSWSASFEFQVIVPYDHRQYVTALYVRETGRTPATWEVAQWNLVLDYGGRLPVTLGILRAAESRTFLVKSWYVAYLGRVAVGGEEQGHVTNMANGQSEEATQAAILGAQEWYDRAQTAYGATGTADERFIKSLYVLLLSRQPNAGELASGLSYLATNGRTLMALLVVGSAERRTITVGGYYTTLLGRVGSASEINGWVNTSLITADIRSGFEASREYFLLASV